MGDKRQDVPTGAEVIRRAAAGLPPSPGVYLMKDRWGKVIYVGKAKRLRSRVASYARREAYPNYYRQKVQAMVAKVAKVEFILTSSEKEALLLEDTLIKRHRPRYNVDLRDDKNYPLFRLSLQDDYPRLSLVRKPARDGARYFGPFEHVGAARQTMRLIQRIFPLRRCSDHTMKNRTRPCLDHEMGRCCAPCAGRIDRESYRELARQLDAFFSGQGREVAARLEAEMRAAARRQDYEQAARLRDRWQALLKTLEGQQVARAQGGEMDVLALHEDQEQGLMRLARLSVRGGRVVAGRVHDLARTALEPGQALGQALLRTYDQEPPPPLILISHLPPDAALLAEVLAERAGRRVELRVPRRGEKLRLMELARLNAAQPRELRRRDQAEALERLALKLGLEGPPEFMECVDISHLGGRLTVASVVAFREGRPHKAGYRRYKVLGLDEAPDDFAAMKQVVARRLGGRRLPPDLLVVDGGKGQLAVARAVLEELPPERRPALAALAKGRGGQPDRVFLPGRKNPLGLKPHDPALLLLMRLRDEAHRFAVSYHRLLRKKALTRSILEEVPGVGPRKARRLLKAFGSLAALKKAPPEELAGRAGVDRASARRVAAFLAALDSPQGQS